LNRTSASSRRAGRSGYFTVDITGYSTATGRSGRGFCLYSVLVLGSSFLRFLVLGVLVPGRSREGLAQRFYFSYALTQYGDLQLFPPKCLVRKSLPAPGAAIRQSAKKPIALLDWT
jgi:hypothetical protein